VAAHRRLALFGRASPLCRYMKSNRVVENVASASNVIKEEPPALKPGRGSESGLILCEKGAGKFFDDGGINGINGQ
jgi:hypothetical protein